MRFCVVLDGRPLLVLGLVFALGVTACTPELREGHFRCNTEDPASCPSGWVCQRLGTDVFHRCYRELSDAYCGNGILDPGEACDGDAMPEQTCRDLGYWSGQLGCDERCRVIEDGCLTMTRLAAGLEQTCGIDNQGSLWCWGRLTGSLAGAEWLTVNEPIKQLVGGVVHSVAMDPGHICALDEQQVIWCWGAGDLGQLGNGSSSGSEYPTPVATNQGFLAVFAGEHMSCGIDNSGDAYCWGLNDVGQLGIGSAIVTVPGPQPVAGGHKFHTLALGFFHSCGVDTAGGAWCWGFGPAGEVGDPQCRVWGACLSPVQVPGLPEIEDIVVGLYFSCALDTMGRAWCWGRNNYGELGVGPSPATMTPVLVSGGHVFEELTAGPSYICGVEAGEVWCWGLFGLEGPEPHDRPQRLEGQQVPLAGVVSGMAHLCGLGPSGLPHCWGYNGSSQLGMPSYNNRPQKVELNEAVVSVSLGTRHTCVTFQSGQGWCWGHNNYGQLGNSLSLEYTLYYSPVPLSVVGDVSLRSVATGLHFSCGLDLDGHALCWGRNELVGAGGQFFGYRPTAISAAHQFEQLTSSSNHTCGLDGSGRAFCWGANHLGQLGDGSTSERTSPVAVAGDHRFGQITAGGGNTCGIDLSGQAWCWGANTSGQLGDGSLVDSPTPVLVDLDRDFVLLSAGAHSRCCGLDTEGRAWCWGANRYGELGNNNLGVAVTPTPVVGDLRFQTLSVGSYHTCGLDLDGKAYCWGSNQENALGTDLPVEGTFAPVAVATERRFREIDSGLIATCAVEDNGDLWCWGSDAYGKLGTFDHSEGTVVVPESSIFGGPQ